MGGSVPHDLFRVRLLPVDPKGRQLGRQGHAGLPERERSDDPPGGQVSEGVLATARSTRPPAAPPEDAERPGDEAPSRQGPARGGRPRWRRQGPARRPPLP